MPTGRDCYYVKSNDVNQLLRRYDFAIARPDKPLKLYSGMLWLVQEYWVRITKRVGVE